MIFQQYPEVLSGLKTQTRRRVRSGDWQGWRLGSGEIAVYSDTNRIRFYVGQQLPIIPKRTYPAIRDTQGNICRVEIVSIRDEQLQSITEADALAEGVPNREEYQRLWERINKRKGTRWEDNPLVWVIDFKLVQS